MKRLIVSILLIGGSVLFAGCGGGSGGSGGGLAPTDANRSAVAQTVVAEVQQVDGVAGLTDLTKSSSAHHAEMRTLASVASIAATRSSATTRQAALTYNPTLNLYFAINTTANGETISFFSDQAGTQPAGSITVAGAIASGTYPQTATI